MVKSLLCVAVACLFSAAPLNGKEKKNPSWELEWKKADTNRDGKVTLQEAEKAGWPVKLLTTLKNRGENSVASEVELSSPAHSNAGGGLKTVISPEEYRKLRKAMKKIAGKRNSSAFDLMDSDKDGKISPREWWGKKKTFDSLDKDGDKQLDKTEFILKNKAAPPVE